MIFDPERQRVPIRVWARAISSETVRQLERLASQPWVVEFVAAMADTHVSEGVAVGRADRRAQGLRTGDGPILDHTGDGPIHPAQAAGS